MRLYLAVTADEYELPLAVEADPSSLGRHFGIKGESVLCSISRKENGKAKGRRFIRIEVDDE